MRFEDKPGRASIGVGVGYYDQQTAVAVGIGATSFDGHWRINASMNYAPGVNKAGAGAGVSFSW